MGCSRYKVATVDGEGALDDVGLELAVDVDGALGDGRVLRGREGDAQRALLFIVFIFCRRVHEHKQAGLALSGGPQSMDDAGHLTWCAIARRQTQARARRER